MTHPDLQRALDAYDAGGVKALEEIARDVPPEDEWLDALVAGAADPAASVVATWLLRATLQRGAELDARRTAALIRALPDVTAHDARLHVCQTVVDLQVPARNAEQLARFLRACAEGEHKFTRAWAVDGFHRLARQHLRYGVEAAKMLDRASRDPAASVRARARRIARE